MGQLTVDVKSSMNFHSFMKNIVKILKILNNIFFEIVIQKKNDRDEYINHLKNESIKKKLINLINWKMYKSIWKNFFFDVWNDFKIELNKFQCKYYRYDQFEN